ncbi:MAG: TldD/PmbA family protein [Thermoleophilia bacterium]|nr:TldD/PmbA family protein [Thermoleophilia bacterium]
MDGAASHADYADARFVDSIAERIATRNGRVEEVARSRSAGVGVRVRLGGAWGFAATRDGDRRSVERALDRALELARAQPAAPDARLVPEPPARGSFESPTGIDPFAVPVADKLDVLAAADDAMRGDPRLKVTSAHFLAFRDERLFASTEGALCEQRTSQCGGGIVAVASDDLESQIRSYPASFRGDVAQSGYEHFAGLDLAGNAPRVAEEAVRLLDAPSCPAERTTLILDGEQLALQLHESVGHAVELDRVLGSETSYAGGSFLSPADLDSLRYGSPLMNVTADATLDGGLGTFAWDDEGVPGRCVPIVREGMLRGFLSSRESAGTIGLDRSHGCMRADGFARQPLVRMTNVNLEPGDAGSLDELIAATERGVYMETNRSWSIDSRRLHFQFATELAYEIVDGRRGRLLKNPTYAGVTPRFWASLDAVCSAGEWRLWPILNCGKGEPGQTARVSHGTAPARFRDVQVGIA